MFFYLYFLDHWLTYKLVRKDVDVNEHERLSKFTDEHKVKEHERLSKFTDEHKVKEHHYNYCSEFQPQ